LSGGRCAFLDNKPGLLLLLPIAHRSEVSQHRHEPRIIFVKGFRPSVRHDKDGAARVLSLPWEQDAVRYQRCFDAEDIEKFLRDGEVLRVPTLQTKPARAGIPGQNRVQES